MESNGTESSEYPIRPSHIDVLALRCGQLAIYTVDNDLIAAIIMICQLEDSWQQVSRKAVLMTYPDSGLPRSSDWDDHYAPFYRVSRDPDDPMVQLTHECIVECFKKFPVKSLEIVQNRIGVLS